VPQRESRKSKQDRGAQRLNAARQGGEAVRATFGAALTRRRFAELVGISPTTVRRWELAGVVRPRREEILGSPTRVFEPADVEFGRRLISLLRRRSGELALEEAAEIVRRGKR
jgi:transcriptional regulator with XRE-family HTH domain